MRHQIFIPAVLCLVTALSAATLRADETSTGVDSAIRAQLTAYVNGFNAADVEALKSLWSPDGEYVNLTTGTKTAGRDNIIADLNAFFETSPNAQLTGQIDTLKLLGDTAAKVSGTTQLFFADGTAETTTFIAIYVKQGENWLVESITETEQSLVTANVALQELSWLIGTWQDQSDAADVTTTCNWSPAETFLVRTFRVQIGDDVTSGSQVIGWDPQFRQIRSWSFFSDGSFSSGFWTKNGDSWIIKGTQTLANGSIAESIRVINDVSDDSMTVQLTSYALDGELQPAREPVIVQRVAEAEAESSDSGNQGGQE